MKAVVVFSGKNGTHWAQSVLHEGFKHCFVVVLDYNNNWIVLDQTRDGPDIYFLGPEDYDVVQLYVNMGMRTLTVDVPRNRVIYPMMLSNCVGVVKSVLGLRKPFIITPLGLWRYLCSH